MPPMPLSLLLSTLGPRTWPRETSCDKSLDTDFQGESTCFVTLTHISLVHSHEKLRCVPCIISVVFSNSEVSKLSVKNQTVNAFGFVDNIDFFATTQPYHCGVRTAIDNM